MSWESVGKFLKGSLPILGTALLGPAGGLVGGLVSKAIGGDEDLPPHDVLVKLKSTDMNNIKVALAKLESNKQVLLACQEAQTKQLEIVNQTMRNESNSEDGFVRRWRPFYGYCVAASWAIQMIGFTVMFGYTTIAKPENLSNVVQQFALLSGSLVSLWGIALAVLGVSVHKRSLDKQAGLEQKGKTLLNKLTGGKFG